MLISGKGEQKTRAREEEASKSHRRGRKRRAKVTGAGGRDKQKSQVREEEAHRNDMFRKTHRKYPAMGCAACRMLLKACRGVFDYGWGTDKLPFSC